MTATKIVMDDMGQLLDAIMLMGGAMARSDREAPSLVLSRARSQSRVLAWAVVLLEQHGIRMSLATGASSVRAKLTYKSKSSVLFGRTARRWYDGGTQASTPPGVTIDAATLAVWSVDALARGHRGDVRFVAPTMSRPVAEHIRRQMRELGWPVGIGDGCITLPARERSRLEDWIEPIVPRVVWG